MLNQCTWRESTYDLRKKTVSGLTQHMTFQWKQVSFNSPRVSLFVCLYLATLPNKSLADMYYPLHITSFISIAAVVLIVFWD